jgi:hypothetical protein
MNEIRISGFEYNPYPASFNAHRKLILSEERWERYWLIPPPARKVPVGNLRVLKDSPKKAVSRLSSSYSP